MTRQLMELTDGELATMVGGATAVETVTTLVETATQTEVSTVTTTVTDLIGINNG